MKKLAMAAMMALVTVPTLMPAPAMAHKTGYKHHHNYRGNGGNYRRKCGGGNGAVGTVAGGAGGAVLGNVLGGGTLGTIAGGVGGALVGRHFDKQNTRSRNGC